MTTNSPSDSSPAPSAELPTELPFVAPCRALAIGAPLDWLAAGWRDLARAPLASLSYGVAFAALGALISWGALRLGLLALYMGLASGFVFVGPFLAMGLYSISYQLGEGQRPTLGYSLREGRSHLKDTLVIGICLLVVLLVWARAATILNVFRLDAAYRDWRDLVPYLGIGTLVGALFSAIVFAATAFALPLLLDRRADAITAVVTSVNATLRNKRVMLVWGALIVGCVLLGFATFFVGFIVLMPLIGHATWHANRATIDASAWPPTHGSEGE